jgi:lipid-A-disaccharide synthase
MIVTGEASGDAHAAELVGGLRELAPEMEWELFGSTGPRLREADVETIVSADDFAVVGIAEIASVLPMFWRAFRKLRKAAETRLPDAVILVDFPEFNLKLARSLRKHYDGKIIYYISPQLWAWRKYRKRTIRDHVDVLLSILPFEKDWYAEQGIRNVEYVGNPLVGKVKPKLTREAFRLTNGIHADKPLIALLPGSRGTEITHILPDLIRTAELIRKMRPDIQYAVAAASGKKEMIEKITGENAGFTIIENEIYDILNAADAAAIASGTATLEAGMIGTPMAIVYKGTELNNKILRPLISVEHFGLINLVAGERIVKEFIQKDFTPESLSEELFSLLNTERNAEVRSRLKAAVEKLGEVNASGLAAEAVLRQLESSRP